MTDIGRALARPFGAEPRARDAPLAPFTTFQVGGPADWLVETRSERARSWPRSRVARAAGVPVTLLGGGSNVLVADAGVRGLVIRAHGGDVQPTGDDDASARTRR